MRKERSFAGKAKIVVLALLVIYVAVLTFQNRKSSVPFQTVEEAVAAAADTGNLQRGSSQDFKKFYGLNANDFDNVSLYYTNQAMGVEELLLVASEDEGKIDEVQEAAEERIDTQLQSFEGYGEEQTKLLQDAVLIKRGNYFLLAVSPQADAVRKSFFGTI